MDNRKFLEMFKNRPYVNVTILRMCNPALFVIKEALSVHSNNEVRDFIRLENRMNAYFKTVEEEIVNLPCRDAVVAVYSDGNWYRGRVESILDTTTGPRISTYLLDYGKYVKVEKSYVRELKPEMKIIPYQAVKLKLKDLYPCSLIMQADCSICSDVTEKWDISAIEFVRSIIEKKNCARMIVEEVDFEGTLHGSLMVLIMDEYVSLNEELVCNKYAQIVSKIKSETFIKESPKSVSEKKEIQYDNLESYVMLKKLKKEHQLKELKRLQDENLMENNKESESVLITSTSENSSKSFIAQKKYMDIYNTMKANQIKQDSLEEAKGSDLNSENDQYLVKNNDVKSKPLCSILSNNEKVVQSLIRENNLKTCSNNTQINLSSKNIAETNKTLQSSNSLGKRFLQILRQNGKNSEQNKNLVDSKLTKNINSEKETNSGSGKNVYIDTLESNTLSTNKISNLKSIITSIENKQTKNSIPESFLGNSLQIPDDKNKIQSEYVNPENSSEYLKNNKVKGKNFKSLSPDYSDKYEDRHNMDSDNVLDNSSLNNNSKSSEIRDINKNASISSINIRKFLTRINLGKKTVSEKELVNKSEENVMLEKNSEMSEVTNNAEQMDLSSKITCDLYISNQREKSEGINTKAHKLDTLSEIINETEKINLSTKVDPEHHNLKKENETKSKFMNNSLIQVRSKLTQEKLKNENMPNFLYYSGQNANLHNLNNSNKNTYIEQSLLSKQISTVNSLTKFPNNPQINFHVKINASDWEGLIWEKEQFIRSIRHGKGIPTPLRNINAAPFSSHIVEILNEFHFPGPSSIQCVMWPAIFRGRNVVAIAPAQSGKTFGYLLPLLSSLSLPSLYEKLPTIGGPIALILCSNWKRVQTIHDHCRILLEKCNLVKVLVMYGGGCETLQKLSLVNGCDILIATPPCLLRLLKDKECKITSLQRCCHLIIEDGNIILETFCKEITEIVKQYALDNKSKAHANILNQMIICSEEWNNAITSFVQCCMREPLIFITSFCEGAIYARVPTYCHVCLKSEVFTLIPQILDGCAGKKIVICTSNVESAQNIAQLVKSLAIYTLIIHSSLFHYEKDSVMKEWKNIRGQYTTVVVVITDDVLLDVDISDANCIIQCNLDEISYSQFGKRYSCMLDHFLTLKDNHKTSPCTCHVLVTEDCEAQANKLVNFLKRLQTNNNNLSKEWEIPKKLLKMASERKRKLEKSQIELCYYLKAFGHCHQLENCKNRHKISQELDQIMDLPRNGRIKVLITNVIDAIHYYGRIIESTDPDGNSKFSHSYLTLNLKLTEYYSIKENCVSEKNIKVGNIYIVEKQGYTYHRVRILDIVNYNKMGEPKSVKIHFIDEGWHETTDAYKLLKIPSDLAAYPAQVVEIYICNVQPIDKCYDWTAQANTYIHNLIIEKEMVGKLVLCLGYTIWLDPFVECVKLENNIYLNETKITTVLIKGNFAIPNPDHIKKLYGLCHGVISLLDTIPENEIKDAETSQVISHAFLNIDQIYNVHVYAIDNPNSFFIQRTDFIDQINNISSECETMIKENKLKKLETFQKGLYCFAPFVDDKWYRACITDEEICSSKEINVFFVDFGDTNIVKKSDIYILPSKYLLLPFQAIHCSLADVIPVQNNWIKEAGDIFYDLTFEGGENKRLFSVKALKQESSSVIKGNSYLIELWCADFNLSVELIKHGFAKASNDASFSNVEVSNKELKDDLSEDFKSEELNSSFAFCKLLISHLGESNENTQKNEISVSGSLIDNTNEEIKPNSYLEKQNQSDEIQSNSIIKSSDIPKLLNDKIPTEMCDSVKYSLPQITWWQQNKEIIITLHLFGVNDYDISFKENSIHFSAIVNEKYYKFEEELFSLIDSDKCTSVVHGQTVEIRLQKSKVGLKWPRLIADQKKKTHIKMDYNHLDDSSSDDEFPRETVKYNPEEILNVEDSDRSEESDNSEEYDDDYLN